ncbi:MAG: DNA-binding protein [Tatlockia sp.]|nr:DNA-binding protein [Tatlockia sp.]
MTITNEQIIKAADELDAQGIRPTLAALRKRIGSGSFTTISEGLNLWKQAHQKQPQLSAQDLLPTEITEHLTFLGHKLWASAMEKANNRLLSERELFIKNQNELNQQIDEAKELNVQINQELEEKDKALEALKLEIEQNQNILMETRSQLEQTKQAHEGYKRKIADETHRNGQKLLNAKKEHDEAIKEAKELSQQLAKIQGKLEQVQEHNKALLQTLGR